MPLEQSNHLEQAMNINNSEDVNRDGPIAKLDAIDMEEDDITNVDMPLQMQIINHGLQELQRRQHTGVVMLLCYVVHALHLLQLLSTHFPARVGDLFIQRERRRNELMSYLVQTETCRHIIRMGPQAFMQLCEKLRGTGIVKDTMRSTLEEQVAKFLHIVGHNTKYCAMSLYFHRSKETISRHFHNVLRAIISLEGQFMVQPSGEEVPQKILNNNRFYPFFKDCIGAIDGTHVRVKVPRTEAPRFRGRKEWPTQNVFAACDFDMKFTYVLAGWEGTASDSRILKDALSREDPLVIPEG
ncbi:hypothetical protein RIF29_23526 [Crotalaria pallida]|uniref:DDE Tnp4 domain-containing protein n=1 Tax=Crotalaria pallida TaxID=3830 RepID=A0AAN9I7I0_CROPI